MKIFTKLKVVQCSVIVRCCFLMHWPITVVDRYAEAVAQKVVLTPEKNERNTTSKPNNTPIKRIYFCFMICLSHIC
jgi:hypothetical protein